MKKKKNRQIVAILAPVFIQKLGDKLRGQLGHKVDRKIKHQIMNAVEAQVEGQLWPRTNDQVGGTIKDQLRWQISRQAFKRVTHD